MTEKVETGGLKVDSGLHRLVGSEIAPGTGVEADAFWASLGRIVEDLGPKNGICWRDGMNYKDRSTNGVRRRKGRPIEFSEYRGFLTEIGYLLPERGDFHVSTSNVDPEVAEMSVPSWSCRLTILVTH